MPRDMTACGRYPPQPKHKPIEFYGAVRAGDPARLAAVMDADPYYVTQDNGAGAPLHFAVTYKQLDMVHHLLNLGAEVNQADPRGWTPLHRAAHLAHYDGYLEIYEYLLSRGADPALLTDDYDPYLNPGRKTPAGVALDADTPAGAATRAALAALDAKYAATPKRRQPHRDVGDWWALYDYGEDVVKGWAADYAPPYPEAKKRAADRAARRARRAAKKAAAAAATGVAALSLTADASTAVVAGSAAAPSIPLALGGAAPSPAVAFLFPGQGAQAVGMLTGAAAALPTVRAMLDEAATVLGYDLGAICAGGPKPRLDDTAVAQPALFVAGLAAVELLASTDGAAAASAASAVAGLSLGEYAALVHAGALSFADGLRLVAARGAAMAAAAALPPAHGMLSIVGLDDAAVDAAVVAGRAAGGTCAVANRLFPTGRVLAGHATALDAAAAAATAAGALKVTRLAVAGGFHTPLMAPAADALRAALARVTFKQPRVPVYSNVTGAPFPDAASIPGLLARQLTEPVLWQETLQGLVAAGKTRLVECGPGGQIKAMVKRVDAGAWSGMRHVNV